MLARYRIKAIRKEYRLERQLLRQISCNALKFGLVMRRVVLQIKDSSATTSPDRASVVNSMIKLGVKSTRQARISKAQFRNRKACLQPA